MFDGEERISHCLHRTVTLLGRVEDTRFSRKFHFADDSEESLFDFFVLLKGDMEVADHKVFFVVFQEFFSQELDCLFFIETFDFVVAVMELNGDGFFFFESCVGSEKFFMRDNAVQMIFFPNEYPREL